MTLGRDREIHFSKDWNSIPVRIAYVWGSVIAQLVATHAQREQHELAGQVVDAVLTARAGEAAAALSSEAVPAELLEEPQAATEPGPWVHELLDHVPVAVGAHGVVRQYLSLLLYVESDDTKAASGVLPAPAANALFLCLLLMTAERDDPDSATTLTVHEQARAASSSDSDADSDGANHNDEPGSTQAAVAAKPAAAAAASPARAVALVEALCFPSTASRTTQLALTQAALERVRRGLARALSRYYPVLDTDEKGKDLLRQLSLIPTVIPSRCYYVLARGGVLRTPAQLQRARLLALVALPQPPLSAAQQEVMRGLQQIAQDEFRVQGDLVVRAPDGVSLLSNGIVHMTDRKCFVVSAALLDASSAHSDPEWGFRCVSTHFGSVAPAAAAAAAARPCHCADGHAVHLFRFLAQHQAVSFVFL